MPFGPNFACKTLSNGALRRLAGSEGEERWSRAQRRGRAREKDRACSALGKPPGGFPSDDEAAESVLAPQALEKLRRRLKSGSGDIVPYIIGDEFEVAVPVRFIEQRRHVGFARGAGDLDRDRASRRIDLFGDGLQSFRRAPHNSDAEPLFGETAR